MSSEIKIAKDYFLYENMKYFRTSASRIDLCSYGDKKGGSALSLLGASPYLEVQNRVTRENLAGKIKKLPPITIDWTKADEADVVAEGSLHYFALGAKVARSISFKDAKAAKLKLCQFAIDRGPLQTVVNQDAVGARNYLAGSNDTRIVSLVFVVVEGALADHFGASASFSSSVSAAGNSLDVTASGGSNGTQTLTLATGSTFAYGLYKVSEWDDSKTHVRAFEDDFYGMR